ncbi:MAG: hypothetical protein K9N55_18380 [Phycisphaerae bacterium]|nr:hypothetical protein [Phycisphaerae bacterium]
MDHLTDNQLLNMMSQSALDDALNAHLADCNECAQRFQALKEPWDVLGQWTLDTPEIDLTDQVLSRVAKNRSIYLKQPQALIRIAASIIIGVGAGSWLGQSVARPVSDEQAAEAMYLDVLTLNSSTGWTAPLLEEGQE